MLILRPVAAADLDALVALADQLDSMNLPSDRAFLAEWRRRFPGAEAHEYADAGHYVLEDAHERLLPAVRAFLQRTG